MADQNKVLDLNELFGQAKTVKVKWKEEEYELLRIEGISPKQALQLQSFQKRIEKLKDKSEPAEEDATDMEKLFDEILKMLCKELPLKEIPFNGKMAIMRFYIEETQGKKALEVALANLTGATSSQG